MLEELEVIFKNTTKLAFEIFGEKALWLHRKREEKWFHYERPTKILYDPLMQSLSKLLKHNTQLIDKKAEIIAATKDFHIDNYEAFKGRDTNKTKVNVRIQLLDNFFKSFISEQSI